MPTKKRKDREKELDALRQALDAALKNPSPRMIARQAMIKMGIKPPNGLLDSLVSEGQHNAGWAKFDERGQNIMREDLEDLGANSDRRCKKVDDALDIRDRNNEDWGKRGTAKRIAHKEGVSVETIRRYMREFPF